MLLPFFYFLNIWNEISLEWSIEYKQREDNESTHPITIENNILKKRTLKKELSNLSKDQTQKCS